MSEARTKMINALKKTVVPALRESGFSGSFPHFRRPTSDGIDLLSFQFDKWGGGFLIEISKCSRSGILAYWGEQIPASKVRAIDNHPDLRHRIKPGSGGSPDDWFRFDKQRRLPSSNIFANVAQQVLTCLDEAEYWWANQSSAKS